ncbi:hypothetical protein [Parendozoicomonas haliclonae]|uniref:Uncharacterized protein n=1 Tax=Parendozoicomonas haliclonae TaxID=1960125 RepID=A0A1X7AR55_9GAMM|nr:hypothetical protein [Parendozoicomonas haliclonae]SMA49887.1 hypothetical protein EHSB41UT_03678 [Parendozoicomonas haliclonae]
MDKTTGSPSLVPPAGGTYNATERLQGRALRDWERTVDTVLNAKTPQGASTGTAQDSLPRAPDLCQFSVEHHAPTRQPLSDIDLAQSLLTNRTRPAASGAGQTPYAEHQPQAVTHATAVRPSRQLVAEQALLKQLQTIPVLREYLPKQRVQILEEQPGRFTLRIRDFYASEEQLIRHLKVFTQISGIPIQRVVINGQAITIT